MADTPTTTLRKLRKIQAHSEAAREALKAKSIDDVIANCTQALNIALPLAIEVDSYETSMDVKLGGELNHQTLASNVQPVIKILEQMVKGDKSVEYAAHFPMARFLLGTAYFIKRRYHAAQVYLSAAVDGLTDTENKYEALLLLVESYKKRGLPEYARLTYVKAMAVDPNRNNAFSEYADVVLSEEPGCLGLGKKRAAGVFTEMRRIINNPKYSRQKNDDKKLGMIDRDLVAYLRKLDETYKARRPEVALKAG